MKRSYLEQAFFLLGTFLTCASLLFLNSLKAKASVGWLISAPPPAIESRALVPSDRLLAAQPDLCQNHLV